MTPTVSAFMVAQALTKAASDLGWRLSVTESSNYRLTLVVLPPLASSRPERNRWPDEPEETEEPCQEEREREFAPDWDVEPEPPKLLSGKVLGEADVDEEEDEDGPLKLG